MPQNKPHEPTYSVLSCAQEGGLRHHGADATRAEHAQPAPLQTAGTPRQDTRADERAHSQPASQCRQPAAVNQQPSSTASSPALRGAFTRRAAFSALSSLVSDASRQHVPTRATRSHQPVRQAASRQPANVIDACLRTQCCPCCPIFHGSGGTINGRPPAGLRRCRLPPDRHAAGTPSASRGGHFGIVARSLL